MKSIYSAKAIAAAVITSLSLCTTAVQAKTETQTPQPTPSAYPSEQNSQPEKQMQEHSASFAADDQKAPQMQDGQAGGIDTGTVQNAIDAITDTDLKASLQTLLDAYQDALDAERAARDADTSRTADLTSYTDAVSAAKDALDAALKDAGIAIGEPQQNPDGQPAADSQAQPAPQLDVEKIKAEIEALGEDNENYASLMTLLETYEDAADAEKTARDSSADSGTLKSLQDAVILAASNLMDALKAAGIETEQPQSTAEGMQQVLPSASAEAPESVENKTDGSDLFQKFMDWISAFMNRQNA